MRSVLRLELVRSRAAVLGACLAAGTVGLLLMQNAPWNKGSVAWTEQWAGLGHWQRNIQLFIWPFMLAVGAWCGLKDARSGVGELFLSTPAPRARRVGARATAVAVAMAASYLVVTLAGAAVVAPRAGFFQAEWLFVPLTGMLAAAAAGALGFAIGVRLPHVLTPPLVLLPSLLALVLADGSRSPNSAVSGIVSVDLAVLSPSPAAPTSVFQKMSAEVLALQSGWFAAVIATGFLVAWSRTAARTALAVLPVGVFLLAFALLVPRWDPPTYVIDEAAGEYTCDAGGRVCVSRVHESALAVIGPAANEVLVLLGRSGLPAAPTSVREIVSPTGDAPPPTVLGFGLDDADLRAALDRGADTGLRTALLGGALAACPEQGSFEALLRDRAARTVVASWFLGSLQPLPGYPDFRDQVQPLAERAWQGLAGADRAEQVRRVADARHRSPNCDGDVLDILARGGR